LVIRATTGDTDTLIAAGKKKKRWCR